VIARGGEWIGLVLCPLLFRLALAAVFFPAGLNKLTSWGPTVALFRDEYRVPILSPQVAAALATAFELGCSLLLAAGLATRLATLPLFAMIAVIQLFVYPGAWPEHLAWAAILLFLLARGPGPLSLDRVIARAR
jgi:putative oxidoreductase